MVETPVAEQRKGGRRVLTEFFAKNIKVFLPGMFRKYSDIQPLMVNVVLGIILMLKTIKDALETYLEGGRDFLFFPVPTLICAGLSMIDHTSAILVVPWVYIFVLIPLMLVPTLRDWCVRRLSTLRFLHIQDLVEMLDSR